MSRIVTVLGFNLLLGLPLLAQHTVSGRVIENPEDPIPLIGLSVYLKSQPDLGTLTDAEGNYSLTVPTPNDTLVYSYVGYGRVEEAIRGRSVIDVVMGESAELLDEVIVTALGIERKKKSLGYAAQEVGGDELVQSREANVVNALSGKVAGVEVVSSSGTPGASANIVIRGRNSLNNNSPLFVVDGVPIDNSFAGSNFIDYANRAIDLNPDDIENISVLKGPAASALYGIRASNGVILITTKKGKQGRGDITFSQTLTFDQVNKLPQQQRLFSQGEFANGTPVYREPLQTNQSWGARLDTLRYDGNPDYPFSRLGRIVGQSDPTATDRQVTPFDNLDNFFQTGLTSNTHLAFSGGGERTNYYVGGTHLRQTGIVPKTRFERTSVKLSGGIQVTDRLYMSGTANYINSGGDRANRGSNLSGVMLGLTRAPVTFDLANGFSDPANEPLAYRFPDGTQRTYWGAYDNPYWSVNRNRSIDRINRIIGNTFAKYDFTSWLSAQYRLGIDYYFEERKAYWDNQSNEFGTGVIFDDLYSYFALNSDFLITAESDVGENFGIRLSLGHNYFNERRFFNVQEGETFIIPDFYDISNVSQVTFADDDLSRKEIVGAFYDAQLEFRDYLFLNVTGRWDWSSTLPTDQVPFFYDSYSLGFVFTEPLGLATSKGFPYGKVRLSYARAGGDAPVYALGNFFTLQEPVKGQTSFLPSNTVGNAGLRPEETRTIEGGLELRFFRNRLGLDLTLYRSETVDQIVEVPVATSSGTAFQITNAGIVENQGIEIQLTAQPIVKNAFSWDVALNFSANENTVVELAEGVQDIRFPVFGLASTSNRAIPGQPFGVLFGTRWSRDEQGNILVNADGYPVYDPQDPGIVGDPNPDWLMGFRNSFRWKGFYLSALLDVRRGGDIFNGTVGVMKNLGIHESTESREEEIVVEGVYAPGTTIDGEDVSVQPNNTPVRLDYDYYRRYPFAGVSEASIEDGSWVRLRELSFSYQFPASLIGGSFIRSLEVGVTMRNLFLITNYSGIDPETNLSGASNSFGRDYFNSPNTRSYGFNLRVGL